MDNVNTFGGEISAFRNNNSIYSYSFNDAGNLYFTNSGSFNQTFLMINGSRYSYNDSNIQTLLDLNFEEFINLPVSSSTPTIDYVALSNQLNDEVLSLQDLLASAQLDDSANADLQTQINNDQATIINLRIELGQGNTVDDFSQTFPYLSLLSGSSNTNEIATSLSQSLLSANVQSNNQQNTIAYLTQQTGSLAAQLLAAQNASASLVAQSASISNPTGPTNPLAVYDLNKNGVLDVNEITQLVISYKNGSPLLQSLVNAKSGKIESPLSEATLEYILTTFYDLQYLSYTEPDILGQLDTNNGWLLNKTLKLTLPASITKPPKFIPPTISGSKVIDKTKPWNPGRPLDAIEYEYFNYLNKGLGKTVSPIELDSKQLSAIIKTAYSS